MGFLTVSSLLSSCNHHDVRQELLLVVCLALRDLRKVPPLGDGVDDVLCVLLGQMRSSDLLHMLGDGSRCIRALLGLQINNSELNTRYICTGHKTNCLYSVLVYLRRSYSSSGITHVRSKLLESFRRRPRSSSTSSRTFSAILSSLALTTHCHWTAIE